MVPRHIVTQGYNVLGQIVTKRSNIGTVLNFDLCDLQKVGQIKNLGIMLCILIRCPNDNNLEMIQPLALCLFSKMAAWRPYLKSDQGEIR
jgi:hypothetical protein